MSGLLFFVTLVLDLICLACVGVFLWLNNFTSRDDLKVRNKGLKRMAGASMTASLVLAFLTSLLSGSADPASAISLSVVLYIIIAVSMVVIIFASCGIIIYRMISKREITEEKTAVWKFIAIAVVGAVISVLLIWLLS